MQTPWVLQWLDSHETDAQWPTLKTFACRQYRINIIIRVQRLVQMIGSIQLFRRAGWGRQGHHKTLH